ncbi:MAG: PmeII family type II restriction endonuclease [Bacteroidota bacterium]
MADVIKYVEDNIGSFHTRRIEGLKALDLNKVLSKKNPYLYKAKHLLLSQEIVKTIHRCLCVFSGRNNFW